MTQRREVQRRQPHTYERSNFSTNDRLGTLRWSDIPVEIGAIVLEHLPNLPRLFSAIQACKQFYNSYKAFNQRTVLGIFRRECTEVTGDNDTGDIFWELEFAIRKEFVKREAVLGILELGWQLFRARYQEKLLIHLVGGLAWTLCIDEREADTVALLRTIWGGRHPFSPSYIAERKGTVSKLDRLRLPTLIPIGERLAELVDGQDKALVLSAIQRLISKRFTEHTVEIRGKKIILHPKVGYTLAIPREKITLRLGMQYTGAGPRDSVALVTAYNTHGFRFSKCGAFGVRSQTQYPP